MTTAARSEAETGDDPRRRKLLEAAVAVFTRYGFRKTSMDEVARAADISRQGLYLSFATKEELFLAALRHALGSSLGAAQARLGDGSRPLAERLVGGFDEWVGRYVGAVGPGAADLFEASKALAGSLVEEHEARFVEAVAKVLRASGLVTAYRPAGLTARQLAETLNATARGLEHGCSSRAAFVDGITVAVRALCVPLSEAG